MRELLKGKGIESSDLYGSLALSGHRRQLSFALSAAQKCEKYSSTHMSGELYILPESILGEFTLQENTGGGLNRLLGLKSAIPLEGYIKAQIFFDPVLHMAFFVDIPHYLDEKSILEMDRLHIRGYCLLESAARCIVEDLSVTVLTPNVRSQVRASFEVSQDGVVEQGHAITHTKIDPSAVTASAIKTELSFWGPLSSLKFENETSTADLSIAGVQVENFSLHSQGSYEESVFKVDYIFDGRIDGQPLHSKARMSWDKENCLSIDDIAFSLGKMDLQGQLKLDCVDFGINGQLSMDGFHLDELPLISANELIPKGKGHLLVTFEKADSEHKQNGHFRFNLNQLKSQGISAETVSYIFNIEDLFGTSYFSTCLMLRDVDLGEVFLEEVILEGAGNDRTMIPLRAHLRGRQSGHSFQGGARFDWSLDSHSCALQMLDLELFGETFALAEPTKIEFSKDSLLFHPLLLKGHQSSFELSGQVSAQKVDLKVTAVTLPVNVLKGCFEGLDKRLIQGEFGFQAHLFGELSSPEIELKLALSDWVVSSGGVWFSQPLSGFWNMELRANACHFHSQIEQQGSAPLTVEGVLPLSFSIRPMVFTLDKLMPWECRIRGESEAASLLKMFYGSKIPLTGQVEIEVDITVTPQDPVVTGGFLLKNGTYEILEIGSVFKGVEAQLALKDRQLQLMRLRASDGVQGNLTAEGFIRLDEEAAPLA
ncbi:MAG: hypothetical protein KDK40_05440, partial [Chlamydiia bacterium]|nr:hypothetical protein [Chlamydiia bacterium]